jgi:hypothetical protein
VIHFDRSPAPEGFRESVEVPGNRWLELHPFGRPPPLWRECEPELRRAFRGLCAYSALYLPTGTLDHFVSCSEDRSLAYDWSNYRYAAGWLNSSKGDVRSSQLLDPFEVDDEWFQLLLPSLQMVTTDRIPAELRERAETMLIRLHLGHDERVVRQRREWLGLDERGELSLAGLERMAPMIAAAIRRRDEGQRRE